MISNKISAVINTYNEESNIRRCLESIALFVDEIVVSDMHSSDKTISICEEFNCKIGFQPKKPFSTVIRQEGIDRASHEWIFIIDADETVPATLFNKLAFIANNDEAELVAIPRRNLFFGIDYTDKGFSREHMVRFFKRGTVIFEDHPHRFGRQTGRRIFLEHCDEYSIIHHGTIHVSDWIRKANSYTDFEAVSLRAAGATASIRTIVLRPGRIFLQHYLINGGWKNGKSGLVFSLLWTTYWIIAAAKLWNNYHNKSSPDRPRIYDKNIDVDASS